MCLFVCALDHGVTEEEPVEKFAEQYREPELEDPYREQEIPKGFEDSKSNSILDAYFTQFFKHNLLACL